MASGFEVLVERAGVGFLRVEFLSEFEGGVERDKALMKLNGAGRLKRLVGLGLQLLQFRKIGTKREGDGGSREGESCGEMGEGSFALGLAEVKQAVGGLCGESKTAAAVE